MSIGDINSSDRGSGARFNSNKPDLALIPLRHIVEALPAYAEGTPQDGAAVALAHLALWQEGGDKNDLLLALNALGTDGGWLECAQVFDYGKRKYAAWNWAKGMQWSVPLACAARHILFGILNGEPMDSESGYTHRGHVFCNIIMLLTYARTFPEGDDRPVQWLAERDVGALASNDASPQQGDSAVTVAA